VTQLQVFSTLFCQQTDFPTNSFATTSFFKRKQLFD